MNKFEYLQTAIMSISTIFIIFAMVYSQNMDVFGLGFLAFGIYYFSKKYGINSIFMKVSAGLIAFVTIVMLISYFSTTIKIEMPTFGAMGLLSSQLDLNTQTSPTQILADKMQQPDSQKYTFAFSVYLKNTSEITNYPEKKYLFYRKDDAYPSASQTYVYTADPTNKYKEFANRNGRNIGLRMGNNSVQNDLTTLYLDYATVNPTSSSSITSFYTMPVHYNFPTAQWIDIVITVNIDIVNIYINGKTITKQIRIENLKAPSLTAPIEFGNMPAHLANFYNSITVDPPTSSFIEYLAKTDGIQT